MKPISFEQWKARMLEETPASEKVECPECEGTGEIEHDCDCDRCTAEDMPCETCDETGFVTWDDLDDADRRKYLTKARYEQAVLNDLAAVANWKGVALPELLVAIGYRVWTGIHSRRLQFEEVGA